MDVNAITAAILTGILSIGAIGMAIKKYLPVILNWLTIITKSFNLIDDLLEAIEPDPATGKIEITAAEIEKMKGDAIALKALWEKK